MRSKEKAKKKGSGLNLSIDPNYYLHTQKKNRLKLNLLRVFPIFIDSTLHHFLNYFVKRSILLKEDPSEANLIFVLLH